MSPVDTRRAARPGQAREAHRRAASLLRRLSEREPADRLVDAVRGNGLGTGGREATRLALEMGEGLELLLDGSVVPQADAEELIRFAARTDARITFVSDHDGLRDMEGVGALLRFRA
jgi:stalled ribosome rescue protein Dom34